MEGKSKKKKKNPQSYMDREGGMDLGEVCRGWTGAKRIV